MENTTKQKDKISNVLITGGTGFIGLNLAKFLKRKGIKEIVLIDNFSTSDRFESDDFEIYDLDISKYSKQLEELIKKTDLIYHLAGSVGVKKIVDEYHNSLMNSININNTIFPLCEKYNKKLIFASTSEVYGNCINAKENDNLSISSPDFGRGSYACAKLMSEFILKSYNFPSVICRFFNIVGKGQLGKYGMVLPNFVDACKSNSDLVIYGNGSSIRTYCDIRDAVVMLYKLRNNIYDNEIYNIGNSKNIFTVLNLAKEVKRITKSKSKIIFKEPKEIFSNSNNFYEINVRIPNTDKINNIYKPKYTLEDIIKSII